VSLAVLIFLSATLIETPGGGDRREERLEVSGSRAVRMVFFECVSLSRTKGSFRNNFPVLNADPSRLAALLVG